MLFYCTFFSFLGFRFAGLQFAKQCFCGHDYGKYPEKPLKECDRECSGKKNEKCGGSWRNSVYSTGLGMSYRLMISSLISECVLATLALEIRVTSNCSYLTVLYKSANFIVSTLRWQNICCPQIEIIYIMYIFLMQVIFLNPTLW